MFFSWGHATNKCPFVLAFWIHFRPPKNPFNIHKGISMKLAMGSVIQLVISWVRKSVMGWGCRWGWSWERMSEGQTKITVWLKWSSSAVILLSSHFQDHVFKKCSENVVSAVVPQISSAIVRHHPEQFQLAKWGSCMCTCISPRMVSSINLIASPADQSETDL